MINRLPKQFQMPQANGKHAHTATDAGAKSRILAKAAQCIGNHPLASLGSAFVVGLVLARLVKR
jgi:ElaB/YqjD/DUF883 family membrane-anchored ribosome-binding protein